MKVWVVALMFLIPLGLSARELDRVADQEFAIEEDADTTNAADPVSGEPINVGMWLAILVGWVGLLVVEVRMNEHVKHLHGVIDKLERYVNTRDNLLALRIDDLDIAARDDGDDVRRERPQGDRHEDWRPQRRH